MFALIVEDMAGHKEIIATSKSFNKLFKMFEKLLEEGYNEACVNIVKRED